MHRSPYRFNPSREMPRVRYFEVTLKIKKNQMDAFERNAASWRVRYMSLYGWALVSASYSETGRVNVVKHLWRIPFWSVSSEIMLDHALGEWREEFEILDFTVEETIQDYRVGMPYDPAVVAYHSSIFIRAKAPDEGSEFWKVVKLKKGGKADFVHQSEDEKHPDPWIILQVPIATLFRYPGLRLGPRDSFLSNRDVYKGIAEKLSSGTPWDWMNLPCKQWKRAPSGSDGNQSPEKHAYFLINFSTFGNLSPFQLVDPYRTAIRFPSEEQRREAQRRIRKGRNKLYLSDLHYLFMDTKHAKHRERGMCLILPDTHEVFWLDSNQLEEWHELDKYHPGRHHDNENSGSHDPVTDDSEDDNDVHQRRKYGDVYLINKHDWNNEELYEETRDILTPGKPALGSVIGKSLGHVGVGQFCWAVDLVDMSDPLYYARQFLKERVKSISATAEEQRLAKSAFTDRKVENLGLKLRNLDVAQKIKVMEALWEAATKSSTESAPEPPPKLKPRTKKASAKKKTAAKKKAATKKKTAAKKAPSGAGPRKKSS